jgi:hypothetical protein
MASSSSPLDELKAFRELQVQERRKLVTAALKAHAESMSDQGAALKLKVMQELIEAMDRAIADEQGLRREVQGARDKY